MDKVIFCDLDDTLLRPETKEILNEDVQAIQYWIAKKNSFVLCTARHHTFLNNITQKLKQYDFDCIGWNGAEIYMDHKVVCLYPFSNIQFLDIYKGMYKYKDYAKVTNIDNEYIYGKLSSYTANMFKKDPNKVIHQTIDEYILTDYKPIIHINYIFPNQQLHKEFYEDYQKNILDHEKLYQCKVTSDYSYDITQKQATKEQGINQYLKLNNIPKNNTIAIGDSLNDIGMFEFCHTSFCMTHGYEEAKQKATYVVDNIKEAIDILESRIEE